MYQAGMIIQADEVDNEQAYKREGLRCIECGEPVFYKRGSKKKPHFAHFKELSHSPDCIYRAGGAINTRQKWLQLNYQGREQRRFLFQRHFLDIISATHTSFQALLTHYLSRWQHNAQPKDWEQLEECCEYFRNEKKDLISDLLSEQQYGELQLLITKEAIDYLCVSSTEETLKIIILYSVFIIEQNGNTIQDFNDIKLKLKDILLQTDWQSSLSEIINKKVDVNFTNSHSAFNRENKSNQFNELEELKKKAKSSNQLERVAALQELLNEYREEGLKCLEETSADDKCKLASSFNSSVEMLEYLSKSQFQNVRTEVAKNLNTSEKTLHDLAQDEKVTIRMEVASNPSTSVETLRQLASDEKQSVQIQVAKNSIPLLSVSEQKNQSDFLKPCSTARSRL